MLSDLLKWGGKRLEPTQAGTSGGVSAASTDEPVIGSKAFPKFLAALTAQPSPVLLDFGPVIGTNVAFFGERLGCKLFIEDIVSDLDRHTKAGTLDLLPGVLDKRFRHADASVDGILCWDIFDFLDKASTQTLARQIIRMLRPGGAVMGLFCTAAKTEHLAVHQVRDRRRRQFPAPRPSRCGRREARRAEPRHHPDVRGARRLGFLPAQEQYPRDAPPAAVAVARVDGSLGSLAGVVCALRPPKLIRGVPSAFINALGAPPPSAASASLRSRRWSPECH